MKACGINAVIFMCAALASVAVAGQPSAPAAELKAVPAELIRFHGHECPGVTIGYRMASEAMKAVPAEGKLVAIAENRTCGVDALQWVTGCTAGKGNLVFKDYGKQAYTLYSAETKKGVRVVFDAQRVPAEIRKDKAEFIKWLLASEASAFLNVRPVEVDPPEAAKTKETAPCSVCAEAVNLSYLREAEGKKICIPCAEKQAAAAK